MLLTHIVTGGRAVNSPKLAVEGFDGFNGFIVLALNDLREFVPRRLEARFVRNEGLCFIDRPDRASVRRHLRPDSWRLDRRNRNPRHRRLWTKCNDAVLPGRAAR